MIKIPLTQGKFSLIDDEDYELVSRYKWSVAGNGYAQGWNGKHMYMHRLIMGFNSPEIDHVNGDKLDNRRTNLRLCTSSQNKVNTKIRSDNKSGYKGVDYVKKRRKWRARIMEEHVGEFDTPEDAARAYDKRIKEVFGEFARTNFS